MPVTFPIIRLILRILLLALKSTALFINKNEVAEKNVQMIGRVLQSFDTIGFVMCARQCEALSICTGVNFYEVHLHCELLIENSIKKTSREGYWYIGNIEWLKQRQLSIVKEENTCAAGSKQIRLSSAVIQCIKIPLCGPPPSIPYAKMQYSGTRLGDKATYTCEKGLEFSVCPLGDGVTYCNPDGMWESISFACQVVETCSDILICNPSYTDGEYFVYPEITGRQKVKVYCHNMVSTEPKEYITLYNDNRAVNNNSQLTSSSPCQWSEKAGDAISVFMKIRIIIKAMTVIQNDFTFATVTFEEPKRDIPIYGKGHGCSSGETICPKLGYFRIDTTGTGLRVDPTLSWITKGYKHSISSFTRGLATIEGNCGGYCGWCIPEMPMQLFVDSRIATYKTDTTIIPSF